MGGPTYRTELTKYAIYIFLVISPSLDVLCEKGVQKIYTTANHHYSYHNNGITRSANGTNGPTVTSLIHLKVKCYHDQLKLYWASSYSFTVISLDFLRCRGYLLKRSFKHGFNSDEKPMIY